MQHIGMVVSPMLQELADREREFGRDDRALQIEETALSSAWFQSEIEFAKAS